MGKGGKGLQKGEKEGEKRMVRSGKEGEQVVGRSK